jgi:hypothetical protein
MREDDAMAIMAGDRERRLCPVALDALESVRRAATCAG